MIDKIVKMKYSGKVFTLLYAALQALLSFVVMKISTEYVKVNFLSMSVIYAVIAAMLGVLNLGKDYLSVYVDSQSSYNKERNSHENTKTKLSDTKRELEEKKDIIHDVLSSMNNTFVNVKTNSEQVDKFRKITTALNNDKRISNCGNSSIAVTQSYIEILKEFSS
ncbi:MAG TPA: hypothetical protein VGI71_05460 [Scandinavium sp.]|jgi:ABC-type multidrug transport system fused ATPase/permease subunit